MLTKTKIALVAALVAGSATAASAQGFDPNPTIRYPHLCGAGRKAQPYIGTSQLLRPRRSAGSQRTLQSAPVGLRDRRNAAPAYQYAPQSQYQYGPFQSAPVRLAPSRGGQQDEIGTESTIARRLRTRAAWAKHRDCQNRCPPLAPVHQKKQPASRRLLRFLRGLLDC